MSKSLSLEDRIQSFIELGNLMGQAAEYFKSGKSRSDNTTVKLLDAMNIAGFHNAWFTRNSIVSAFVSWSKTLSKESVYSWINTYGEQIKVLKPKSVAVIMAGNIPLVGFHDFMCTLIAGHNFVGKLSSDDKILLPAIADLLCLIEPEFSERIQFAENTIKDFEAIIATGSSNTARYFEYYFSKYPHIIRKNRNSVAVLTGTESDTDLLKLGDDICLYFGLGCRNVSKVFIPVGFDPTRIFASIAPYQSELSMHNKYMNNYGYQRSIYLLNNATYLDNEVMLLTESANYSSPISVLYYEVYNDLEILKSRLANENEMIQCIVSDTFISKSGVNFGSTQSPGISDYADRIDTMKFLTDL